MSWQRMIHRNQLEGEPSATAPLSIIMLVGDIRRLIRDQRDERHLRRYAEAVGITPEQARAVLDLFFDQDCEGQTYAT